MSDVEFGSNGSVTNPATGAAPEPAAPVPAQQTRPLKGRYTPMKWVLILYAVGEAGLFLATLGEMYFLFGESVDIFLAEGPLFLGLQLAYGVAGLLQFVMLIASYVLVSMWTYRAMKNLHIVREPGVEMSPGWAVGWYFIPIANLWKPFEGMLQIWRDSHHMAGQDEKVANYVGWWWALWIIGNILANLSIRLGGIFGDGAAYGTSLWFYAASSIAAIVCTILLLKTTRRVTDMQAAMREGGVADTFS